MLRETNGDGAGDDDGDGDDAGLSRCGRWQESAGRDGGESACDYGHDKSATATVPARMMTAAAAAAACFLSSLLVLVVVLLLLLLLLLAMATRMARESERGSQP
ncbi:hypothetical protein F5Y10DRAFT_270766 [Nemania abortiva]|nr:hypothetical protein F5Y10DRAFT_270766 [Nemania abortiva]